MVRANAHTKDKQTLDHDELVDAEGHIDEYAVVRIWTARIPMENAKPAGDSQQARNEPPEDKTMPLWRQVRPKQSKAKWLVHASRNEHPMSV